MPHPTRANRVGITALLLALLVALITGLWLVFLFAVAAYFIVFRDAPNYGWTWSDNARSSRER